MLIINYNLKLKMNILIVNAFGNSSSGKTKFNSFLTLIKKIFKKVSEFSGIENFNYIIRTPSNIEDYIFNYYSNPNNETVEVQNRKNFDSLDMIFIDGSEIYSPWKNRSNNLANLIRLCKLANKVLYAGGVALEILVFYLATGSVNEYNIINSDGQIKALEEINKISNEFLKIIKKNELFLDYVTGDLLEYKNNDNTWEPVMNIGLHHQITAEKYFQRGKFVLTETFKGKDYIKNEYAMNTFCQEIKVKILRQYVSHYLVENCPMEFIGICSLEWFPHFINVSAKKFQFKTICKSEKGPIVLEHENTIGVAFHAQEKFIDSAKILKNFIFKNFNEVKDKLLKNKNNKIFINNTEKKISPIFKIFKANDDKLKGKFDPDDELPLNPYCFLGKVNFSCLFNRTKKINHEAKHVGLGINNREMIFVENNCINQRPFFKINSYKKEKHNYYNKMKDNNNFENHNNFSHKKCLSNINRQKRTSFVSNSSKENKTITSINSVSNRNIKNMIIKRAKSSRKRKEFKGLDINNLKQSKNNYDNPTEIKLKLLTDNNILINNYEKTKNKYENKEINKSHFLLDKLISPKSTNNLYNFENEIEKNKEDKDDKIGNYQNKSKYPRCPTVTELGILLNNFKKQKIKKFDKNNLKRKINRNNFGKGNKENNLSPNDKTTSLRKVNYNNFLNINSNESNDIKKNKKYVLKKNYFSFTNGEINKVLITKEKLNDNYKPKINEKYNIKNYFDKF